MVMLNPMRPRPELPKKLEVEPTKSCETCLHSRVCSYRQASLDALVRVPVETIIGGQTEHAKMWGAVAVAIAEHCKEYTRATLPEEYQELIMAVGSKFPNETRHETALRYINRAEEVVSGPAMDATPKT